jgi:hypothetical protein
MALNKQLLWCYVSTFQLCIFFLGSDLSKFNCIGRDKYVKPRLGLSQGNETM